MPVCIRATQGHLYKHGDAKVIAMESGPVVRVRQVLGEEAPWMSASHVVKATWLKPMPMKYFHAQVPKHG